MKDELIAKQKDYIRYLKRAIHSESIIDNVTAGVRDNYDAEIAELEKAIEDEPDYKININPQPEWTKCDICGCHPSVIIRTEYGTFCKDHVKYIEK